jgi:hypothetical protein
LLSGRTRTATRTFEVEPTTGSNPERIERAIGVDGLDAIAVGCRAWRFGDLFTLAEDLGHRRGKSAIP